jgi:hypothetical protein
VVVWCFTGWEVGDSCSMARRLKQSGSLTPCCVYLQATRQEESASPDTITLCSAKTYGTGTEYSSLTNETPCTLTHRDYTGDP